MLPILINQFVDEHRTLDERTRVGQCLVNLSKQLGDMAPVYAPQIMHAMLRSARSPDSLIRVSALSNIGEICALLHFSLKTYIVEILICLESLLQSDPTIEVRRAAVMFFHLLFNQINKTEIMAAEEQLKRIYRLLKHSYNTSLDDTIQLHSQLALEQLGRIAKQFYQVELPFDRPITM